MRSLRCRSCEAASEYAGASERTMESFWGVSGSDIASDCSFSSKSSGCLVSIHCDQLMYSASEVSAIRSLIRSDTTSDLIDNCCNECSSFLTRARTGVSVLGACSFDLSLSMLPVSANSNLRSRHSNRLSVSMSSSWISAGLAIPENQKLEWRGGLHMQVIFG